MSSDLLKKIKDADKKNLLPVEVPEWGLTVHIKQMSVGDRDRFESAYADAKKKGREIPEDFRSKFLVTVLCDEKGEAICGPDDFQQLAGLSIKAVEPLFAAAMKHNALTDSDVEELGKA